MVEPDEIEVGDFVRVGKSSLTWKVVGLPQLTRSWATLESGQTGRHRYEPLTNLRLHSKGRS